MIQEERRKEIIRLLQTNVSLETNRLAAAFGVSPVTVRRDFEYFEKQGFLTCTYGGAIVNHSLPEFARADLESTDLFHEKELIAKEAVKLVEPNSTIILDSGSTVKELAIELLEKRDIVVLTNSILAINVLAQAKNNISLFVFPGQFRLNSMGFFGSSTVSFLEMVHADYAFLGTTGVSADSGCTIKDLEEVYAKTMMSKAAEKTVVLADHTKLGVRSLFTALPLSDVDMLITGSGNEEEASRIAQSCKQVVTVDVNKAHFDISDELNGTRNIHAK